MGLSSRPSVATNGHIPVLGSGELPTKDNLRSSHHFHGDHFGDNFGIEMLLSSGRLFRNVVLSTATLLHCSRPTAAAAAAMSTHTTTRRDGTITVAPRNEATQSALMVICHGLGDSAEGFADVAEQLASQMPFAKFILPTAPTQPVSMNMGMPMPSWYDIKGLDERANEDCRGISESRARIEGILAKEHADTGLPYSRMILAGFSQGGALSLFTGLQLEHPIAGIVVLSGYLPAANKFKPKQFKVPVWHGHGTMDPLVHLPMAEKTKQRLTAAGIENYTLKTYSIPHSVSPEELKDMMRFVATVVPPDDSCVVTLKDPKDMSVKELKAAIQSAGLGSKAIGLMEKSEFIKLVQDHRAGKL